MVEYPLYFLDEENYLPNLRTPEGNDHRSARSLTDSLRHSFRNRSKQYLDLVQVTLSLWRNCVAMIIDHLLQQYLYFVLFLSLSLCFCDRFRWFFLLLWYKNI